MPVNSASSSRLITASDALTWATTDASNSAKYGAGLGPLLDGGSDRFGSVGTPPDAVTVGIFDALTDLSRGHHVCSP